jgi:DNA polymerase III epsilon subunit-like protein
MEHVMVDLETLGRRAGCSILSIGAVAFDPTSGELGTEFYVVVNRESCMLAGLHEDPETIAWWEKQNAQAQEVLGHATEGGLMLPEALAKLTEFLSNYDLKAAKVWGNGADFDNAILAACYAAVGSNQPWEFWNSRCYRTLKSFRPQIKMQRQGTYHNALDDAKSQASHAIQLLKVL